MSNSENSAVKAPDVVWLVDTGSDLPSPQADRLLSLRNVSEMFVVSQLKLRYYEMRGLIRRGNVQDGVPVYGWADCERISFIVQCRKAGLTLADISAILDATDEDVSPESSKAGQELCMVLVERLERRRKVLDDALSELSHAFALLTARLIGDTRKKEDRA
ncbi:MAG TPA: MerR family transcriptional regulator [Xanthobacteraceae bacterium]|jgi:DNA-binding transcriptional MerR regulator